MPIYEYKCEKCDATFEAMQAVSAKPLKTCNGLGCNDKGNGKVNRLVSASGFILKGSGWYTSDYPSEARKKGWESESKQTQNVASADTKQGGGPRNPLHPLHKPLRKKKLLSNQHTKNLSRKILTQETKNLAPKPPNNNHGDRMAEPENLYKNIFTSLIDGVLVVSTDLTIIKGNQAAEEMFQRSMDFFEGELLSELFPDQPILMKKFLESITAGAAYHYLEGIGHRKSNNSKFPVNLTFSPILKNNGESSSGVLLIQDTSLIKELQETSRQIEHLSTLNVLTMGMAHEIRNPLSGIRGSAQLLLKDLENKDQREYLEIVISEVDRINRLVKRMVNLSRPTSDDFEPINIHKLLEEILTLEKETLIRKKGGFLQTYDPSLPAIDGNEDELKQVFLNLVKNAVEASPEGGLVKIVTKFCSNYAFKKTSDAAPINNIIVDIIDSGPGMTDETIQNLFTPFFTTKKRGTGLGMVVSLKIIKSHNGKIKVSSERGVGTKIQVFLPIQKEMIK